MEDINPKNPIEVKQEENLLEKTSKIVAELKVENDRKEALILREERAKANAMLGGQSYGGSIVKTPEELEKDKSQRIADEITNAFR